MGKNISEYSEHDFGVQLSEIVSPSSAIASEEFLRGRRKELEGLRQALHARGRQAFIHGTTGVGKTSLGLTAAYSLQSSSELPIYISCDEDSSLFSIVRIICEIAEGITPNLVQRQSGKSVGASWMFSYSESSERVEGRVPEPKSITECVAFLQFHLKKRQGLTAIVIDEVNKLQQEDRERLSVLVRNLSEANLDAKFIFCGIGDSLDDLLTHDRQTFRFLHPIKLETLGLTPLREIVDSAFNFFEVEIDETTTWRICRLSDGFPHFVHLLCEKCLWSVFRSLQEPIGVARARLTVRGFLEGVQNSIESVEEELKNDYNKAVQKYDTASHIILAAVADDHELDRQMKDIFNSYERICRSNKVEALKRNTFNTRVYNLCSPEYGSILSHGIARSYYRFSKQRMRGYARLRAQNKGIDLYPDHPLEPKD